MSADRERAAPEWDFYPCGVDGAPASIQVDLSLDAGWGDRAAELGSTLYVFRLVMGSPGPQGMGSPEEDAEVAPLFGRLVEVAEGCGARQVGRLRTGGRQELAFMGPAGLEDELGRLGLEVLGPLGREHDLVYQADPTWSWYDSFLYPDPERRRWMRDRRAVQELRDRGHALAKPRRIEHRLLLADREARSAAASDAIELGFGALDPRPDEGPDEERVLVLRRPPQRSKQVPREPGRVRVECPPAQFAVEGPVGQREQVVTRPTEVGAHHPQARPQPVPLLEEGEVRHVEGQDLHRFARAAGL